MSGFRQSDLSYSGLMWSSFRSRLSWRKHPSIYASSPSVSTPTGSRTDLDADAAPRGLSEDVIRLISAKKQEPDFLLDWRLRAYRHWLTMTEPRWPNVRYPPIDYQNIVYYSAPKAKPRARRASTRSIRPCARCSTSSASRLAEQERLVGRGARRGGRQRVGGHQLQGQAGRARHHLLFLFRGGPRASRAGAQVPGLGGAHERQLLRGAELGGLHRRQLLLHPEGRALPDGAVDLLPHQRRRHRAVRADADHRRARQLRQLPGGLHGAAPRRATSCTPRWSSSSRTTTPRSSTRRCRTGTPATRRARAASTTSSPSGARRAGRNSKISWTQVETGSAITWKYPSVLLIGDGSVGEFYSVAVTNHHQQADTGTKMIHIGKNTKSTIVSKGISAGHGQNTYRGLVRIAKDAAGARNYSQCDSLLIGDDCGAHTVPYLDVRNTSSQVEHEASTSRISEDQLFYCRQRGLAHRGCRRPHRQRLLQGGLPPPAHGVRRRGAEAPGRQPGRERRADAAAVDQEPARGSRPASRSCAASTSRSRPGEVCAIMGPNGSGKSTLGQRARRARGHHRDRGRDPLPGQGSALARPRRAGARRHLPRLPAPGRDPRRGQHLLSARGPQRHSQAPRRRRARPHGLPGPGQAEGQGAGPAPELLARPVNEGFSGGEKKRNEILQMSVLEPRLAVLDETDSGLDIDALREVAAAVQALRGPSRAIVVITHHQRLLDYLVPDRVYVLSGRDHRRFRRQVAGRRARAARLCLGHGANRRRREGGA